MLKLTKKNKILTNKEYKQLSLLRVINIAVIGLLSIILIFSVYSIYTRVYNIIGQTEIVIASNPSLNVDILDFENFEKTKKTWTEKKDVINFKIERNPFIFPIKTIVTTTEDGIE